MKASKDNKFERTTPVFVTQFGSAARRLCPHCRRYVFPIGNFFMGSWRKSLALRCKNCGKTSYTDPKSMGWAGLAAGVVAAAVVAALESLTDYATIICLIIAVGAGLLARLYSIRLLARVRPTDPFEHSHMLASAELSVSLETLSTTLEQVTDARSVLLFGPGESGWLWLVRHDQIYYIRLALYPKRLKALRPKFENAAQKLDIRVEEKIKGNERLLLCRLGTDPQAAGKLAWAIFTDTMGLERDAKVSMKWL